MEPHGGSADDAARVEELMSHDDPGDNKWTDIWAKIAECTSSAYAGECVGDAVSHVPASSGQSSSTPARPGFLCANQALKDVAQARWACA